MISPTVQDPPKRNLDLEDGRSHVATAFAPVLAFARMVEDPKGSSRHAPDIAQAVAVAAIHARNSLIEKEPKEANQPAETFYHRAESLLSAIANAALQTTHDDLSIFELHFEGERAMQMRPSREEAYADLHCLCAIAAELFPYPDKEGADD